MVRGAQPSKCLAAKNRERRDFREFRVLRIHEPRFYQPDSCSFVVFFREPFREGSEGSDNIHYLISRVFMI